MSKHKVLLLVPVLIFFTIVFCNDNKSGKLTAINIELFKNTPVWDLAKAVEKQDTSEIKNIIRDNPKISVDYQEPQLGFSLLIWSIYNDKYYSSEQLLKHGANPNLKTISSGTSAVIWAADNLETSELLRLVLKYGGNPNAVADSAMSYRVGTPLIAASGSRLESVKMLVEAGADLNYVFDNRRNAILSAMIAEKANILRYLLIEKKAEFYEPKKYGNIGPFVAWLRGWVFPLDSENHKIKMEIVDYLKEKGNNYWETDVPESVKKHYSEEFCKKY